MSTLRRVPALILLLFAADLALALAPLLDYWAGSPFNRLRNFINLDAEGTLPTWYSSMQWFCAGVLFALLAVHAWQSRLRGRTAVLALALICLTFSADEVTTIHEWLGHESDALLPGGSRADTAFASTGLWPFVIGIPVLALVAWIVAGLRQLFQARSRTALRRLVLGLGVMFSGALVVELGANAVTGNSADPAMALAQVVLEEGMEMLGVTLIVWAAYEVLAAYGFEVRLPPRAALAATSGYPAPTALTRISSPHAAALAAAPSATLASATRPAALNSAAAAPRPARRPAPPP